MNIIVRNIIESDIEDLARVFSAQGWPIPSAVFKQSYAGMLGRLSDVLVAEAGGQPAGYMRIEWFDAGEEAGHALSPEIQEFVVLGKFAGYGVADAMIAEAERRVAERTGEIEENALMSVYGGPPPRAPFRGSYVLDGLLVGKGGTFIRSKGGEKAEGGAVISIRKMNRQ
jgi:hypothetical protein